MSMQTERLAALCDRMLAVNAEALPPGLSRDELVVRIHSTTALLKELTKESNELFSNEIKPMLAAAHLLSEEDENAFFAVAQKLSSFSVRVDTGMALSIYQALLQMARCNGDRDKILKYLYWCGITLYYNNENKKTEILMYFSEGAAYKTDYFTFESRESRQYIHRCMGNYEMMLFNMTDYEKAREVFTNTLAFFNQLMFFGTDADYPWANYFLSCMNHYRQYFTQKMHSEPKNLSKDEVRHIFRIALMMSKLASRGGSGGRPIGGGVRYEMALWEAQFVSGQISIANFCENIKNAQARFDPADYSSEAMHTNIMLPCYIIFYVRKLLPGNTETEAIIQEQLAHITGYMKAIPSNIDPGALAQYISLFLRGTAGLMPEKEHFEWVVKLTTYRHKPTFAHAITVSKLTSLLARAYLKKHPSHFIGILGIETEEQALEKMGELTILAENCGLCHDVGKLPFIRNQTMYARILSGDEMQIIQDHVNEGLTYFEESEDSEELNACRHVINGHHVYYDGSAGYPRDFELAASPYKALVHTVTVADSLDSGTDDIGKVYADAKPLSTVIGEITEAAGTRYSPYVAGLLGDKALLAGIHEILYSIRPDAYYAAYRFAGGEE